MSSGKETTSTTTISPSQRVSELNDIDDSVSKLLSSAASATSILSNQDRTSPRSLESAQQAFTDATSSYFSTLSSIEVRLRRQVYALEEAGLVKPGDDRDARRGRALNEDNALRRVGGGPLDSSWLNARATNSNDLKMERDLLEKAKTLMRTRKETEGAVKSEVSPDVRPTSEKPIKSDDDDMEIEIDI